MFAPLMREIEGDGWSVLEPWRWRGGGGVWMEWDD